MVLRDTSSSMLISPLYVPAATVIAISFVSSPTLSSADLTAFSIAFSDSVTVVFVIVTTGSVGAGSVEPSTGSGTAGSDAVTVVSAPIVFTFSWLFLSSGSPVSVRVYVTESGSRPYILVSGSVSDVSSVVYVSVIVTEGASFVNVSSLPSTVFSTVGECWVFVMSLTSATVASPAGTSRGTSGMGSSVSSAVCPAVCAAAGSSAYAEGILKPMTRNITSNRAIKPRTFLPSVIFPLRSFPRFITSAPSEVMILSVPRFAGVDVFSIGAQAPMLLSVAAACSVS